MSSNIGRSIEPSHIEKRVYELEKNSKSVSLKKKEFVFDSINDFSYWDKNTETASNGDFVLKKKISVGIDDNKIIKASFYQRNKLTGEKPLESKFKIGSNSCAISKDLNIDIVHIDDFDYEDLKNFNTGIIVRSELFVFFTSGYINRGLIYNTKPLGFKIVNGDLLLIAQSAQSQAGLIFAGGPTEELYVLDPDYELVVEILYIE